MGFFKSLFEKKVCDFCGGEIGLLGNRKLEDGNMCKNCAAKLSPWFSDRRSSTKEEIAAQLAYREANENELRTNFRPTGNISGYYKLFYEMNGGVPTRFVVTRNEDYREGNPDIINFSDVTSVQPDIKETWEEQKRRNEQGEMVSYYPPRYEYRYEFYINMLIAGNPYFDDIRFKLNRNTVEVVTERRTNRSSTGIGQFLLNNNDFDPSYNPEWRDYQQMCDQIVELWNNSRNAPVQAQSAAGGNWSDMNSFAAEMNRRDAYNEKIKQLTEAKDFDGMIAAADAEIAATNDAEYKKIIEDSKKAYQYMAEQARMNDPNYMIKKMEEEKKKAAEAAGVPYTAPAAAAASSGKCPACGAEGNKGKFCEYCGAKL